MSNFKAVNNYGLDAELAEKMNAKYDKNLENDLQGWIEESTGVTFDKPFAEMLQSGVVLCQLVNAFMPNKIKKINEAGGLFKLQENITSFLKVCREIGVPEASLFPTESLAQMKDMNQVLTCLNAFRQKLEGKKASKDTFKVEKGDDKAPEKTEKKSKWVVKPGGTPGAVSLLNSGSANTMEQSKYVDPREQIKRNQLDGKGTGTETSKWNDGSSGMERLKYTDAREAIKRQELDGKGTDGEISALNQGSAGMERLKYTDPREQIKRGEL